MTIRRMPARAASALAAALALTAAVLLPQSAHASSASAATRFSESQLDVVQEELSKTAAIPGTAWATDPRLGRVVVTADSTVTGARRAKLDEVVSGSGGAVVVRTVPGRLTRFLGGGDAVYGRSARCTAGFNVTRPGRPAAFLTAGHCGNAVPSWSATQGGPEIAKTVASVFPGHDYALAEYTAGGDHPSVVNLHGSGVQAIREAALASVGETVERSGSSTGVHSGKVTGLDATVNYPEGQVTGLIKTSVCGEPGDSGGPLFDHDKGLGVLSGGVGSCGLQGGETYYQPLPEVLAALKAQLG